MKRSHATMSGSSRRGAIVSGGSSGVGVAIVASLLKAEDIGKVYVTGQKPLAASPLQKLLDLIFRHETLPRAASATERKSRRAFATPQFRSQ